MNSTANLSSLAISFPGLFKNLKDGVIVLFTSLTSGRVLYIGESESADIGDLCEMYAPKEWRRLLPEESVTIRN